MIDFQILSFIIENILKEKDVAYFQIMYTGLSGRG
jgi:hypothetical protein